MITLSSSSRLVQSFPRILPRLRQARNIRQELQSSAEVPIFKKFHGRNDVDSFLAKLKHFELFEMAPYIYTYPPKTAYKPVGQGTSDVMSAWEDFEGQLNLYIHVPFCQMKCSFCNLFTRLSIGDDEHDRYVQALVQEMTQVAATMQASRVELQTIHFGGGTPSLLKASLIAKVIECAFALFKTQSIVEISIEGSPATFSQTYLSDLYEVGINAVSLGVQSFKEDDLRHMGRRVDVGKASVALAAAASTGFKNVTVDLINGLPGHSWDTFFANIQHAVKFGARTLQIYPLEVRQRTRYGRQGVMNSVEKIFKWQQRAADYLLTEGFAWHTLPTFGRKGCDLLHVGDNWQEAMEFAGVPTLGIGAGARSYAPDLHYTSDNYFMPEKSAKIIKTYYDSVSKRRATALSVVELTKRHQFRRRFLLSLLAHGANIESLRDEFGFDAKVHFSMQLEALATVGYLTDEAGTLGLTPLGKLHSSGAAQLFFDLETRAEATGSRYYSIGRSPPKKNRTFPSSTSHIAVWSPKQGLLNFLLGQNDRRDLEVYLDKVTVDAYRHMSIFLGC